MKSLLEVYQNDTCDFKGSAFKDAEGDEWPAPYLYKQAKKLKLEPEKVCLRHISMCNLPWSDGSVSSIDNFIYHSVRVQNADTSIPIIISWDGFIMDGWHRLVKAVLEGKKTIEAYRFETYIEPEKKASDN